MNLFRAFHFFLASFVWFQLHVTTRGASVSLTVDGGGNLSGPQCPETTTLLCEGVDLSLLRWRYNGATEIHVYGTGDSPSAGSVMPERTDHPAFLSVRLINVTQFAGQRFANFTSTLTINLRYLQDVTNITCGDLVFSSSIPVDVTLIQLATPNITRITANYQSTVGLSSVEVMWKKLGTQVAMCFPFLLYEVGVGANLAENISHSSCRDSLCIAQFNISEVEAVTNVSLRAVSETDTSGTTTFPLAQDSGQYFTPQVNIADNCEATARCVAGSGLSENATCSVQSMGQTVTSQLNREFPVQRLQPNTMYRFMFSVLVDETLKVSIYLERSTGTCGTLMAEPGIIAAAVVVPIILFICLLGILICIITVIMVQKRAHKKKYKVKDSKGVSATEMQTRETADGDHREHPQAEEAFEETRPLMECNVTRFAGGTVVPSLPDDSAKAVVTHCQKLEKPLVAGQLMGQMTAVELSNPSYHVDERPMVSTLVASRFSENKDILDDITEYEDHEDQHSEEDFGSPSSPIVQTSNSGSGAQMVAGESHSTDSNQETSKNDAGAHGVLVDGKVMNTLPRRRSETNNQDSPSDHQEEDDSIEKEIDSPDPDGTQHSTDDTQDTNSEGSHGLLMNGKVMNKVPKQTLETDRQDSAPTVGPITQETDPLEHTPSAGPIADETDPLERNPAAGPITEESVPPGSDDSKYLLEKRLFQELDKHKRSQKEEMDKHKEEMDKYKEDVQKILKDEIKQVRDDWQKELADAKNEIAAVKTENEHLRKLLKQKQDEIDELIRQIKSVSDQAEAEKLIGDQAVAVKQVSNLKEKIKMYNEKEQEVKDLRDEIEKMTEQNELDSKRALLASKEEELNSILCEVGKEAVKTFPTPCKKAPEDVDSTTS